jgi:hypothetical protein
MKRLVAIFAALVMLLGISAPPAVANGLDASNITIWESDDSQTGGPGDHWTYWKSDAPRSVPDLRTEHNGLFLGCDSAFDNWNNCITTINFYLQKYTCIKFYDGVNYATSLRVEHADGSTRSWQLRLLGTSGDNKYSSFRWGDWDPYYGSCSVGKYD